MDWAEKANSLGLIILAFDLLIIRCIFGGEDETSQDWDTSNK